MKAKYLLLFSLLNFYVISNAQQWTQLNGPVGATVVSSVITYENGEIFALIPSGKVFRSLDKAKTWENISNGLGLISNRGLTSALMKESPTGEIFLYCNQLMYKYNPTSKVWLIMQKDLTLQDFAFSPDGTKIYGGNYDVFYISNNGSMFNKVQTWWTHSVEFLCLGNNNNFVRRTLGASGEIWKFDDDGSNLRVVTTSRSYRSLFFHKKSKKIFDLGLSSGLVSNDMGESWSGFSFINNLYFSRLIELQDGSILGFYNDAYKSLDEGKTWAIDNNYEANNIGSLAVDDRISQTKNDEIVISRNKYSYFITDMKFNTIFEMPVKEPSINSIKQFGENNILSTTSSNIQISNDDGLNWNKLIINSNFDELIWKDGTMATYLIDSIRVSIDQFKTYTAKPLPELIFTDNLLLDNNENIVLLDYNKSYISSNKGDTWQLIGENLELPNNAEDLKISKQNIIYTGFYRDSIYYSTDYGLSWNNFFASLNGLSNEVFLSINNVFIWIENDPNTGLGQYKFTTDFGHTKQTIPLDFNERIIFIDEYDNVYIRNSENINLLKVKNILTNQVIDISLMELNLTTNENLILERGDNGYLYAAKQNAPLYKYNNKFENELAILSGNIKIDENQNCIKDLNDVNSINFQFGIKGNKSNYNVFTKSDGSFKFFVNPDTYSINLNHNSIAWEACNFPANIQLIANNEVKLDNLLVKPREYCADLISSINFQRLRRCFENNRLDLAIRNTGTIQADNVIVEVFMDDYFENLKSSISPKSVTGNKWTFEIPFIKRNEILKIDFTFKISCTASLNQEHCVKALIDNKQQCQSILPLSDTLRSCEKNIGSFDPNDKMVYVNGFDRSTFQPTDTVLEYLIRFQNSGTDTAFNIVLKDKLDYNLDWLTFFPVASSHDYSYSLNTHGMLEVKYSNIMLPDSNINESASHGYFRYRIKPKLNLKIGTPINNKADIYFDFNEAVATNTISVKLSEVTKVNDIKGKTNLELVAIPNPFTKSTKIKLPEHLINQSLQCTIFGTEGKRIQSFQLSGSEIVIQKNDLRPGVYIVNIRTEVGNRAYCKIVVL
ncbi:MAG: T9SS type A sorting domain-containing protein [Saprospiraceae bacterium]|nr:T9SS type A sorting domain-containing protein [Candidatus Defluviibacterium haderslevense]